MRAKFTTKEASNAKNLYGDKEEIKSYQVVAYQKGEFKTPVTVRCWMSRSASASTVYASIWINAKETYVSGYGSASGYGYHKESAAIGRAIRSAGIKLFGSPYGRDDSETRNKPAYIDGCGDSAIRDALEAITRALGFRKFTIV